MSFMPAAAWAGASAVGGIISAYGQVQQGKEAHTAYDYNAQIAEQSAGMTRTSAALDEYKAKENLKTQVGQQIGGYAAGGVVTTSGSPVEVMKDTLKKGYLDIAINKYNAEIQARSYESQAAQERRYGEMEEKAGKTRGLTTLISSVAGFGSKVTMGS